MTANSMEYIEHVFVRLPQKMVSSVVYRHAKTTIMQYGHDWQRGFLVLFSVTRLVACSLWLSFVLHGCS